MKQSRISRIIITFSFIFCFIFQIIFGVIIGFFNNNFTKAATSLNEQAIARYSSVRIEWTGTASTTYTIQRSNDNITYTDLSPTINTALSQNHYEFIDTTVPPNSKPWYKISDGTNVTSPFQPDHAPGMNALISGAAYYWKNDGSLHFTGSQAITLTTEEQARLQTLDNVTIIAKFSTANKKDGLPLIGWDNNKGTPSGIGITTANQIRYRMDNGAKFNSTSLLSEGSYNTVASVSSAYNQYSNFTNSSNNIYISLNGSDTGFSGENYNSAFSSSISGNLAGVWIGKNNTSFDNQLTKTNFEGEIDYVLITGEVLLPEEANEFTSTVDPLADPTPYSMTKTEPESLFYSGYQNSEKYRIPSLITSTAFGTVIAAIDQRMGHQFDYGNINTMARISTDGGYTFQEPQILIDLPGQTYPGNGTMKNALLIDPLMLEDKQTGRIHMIVDMFPESKALMGMSAGLGDSILTGSGYHTINDKRMLFLRDYTNTITSWTEAPYTKTYYLDENGIVYTLKNKVDVGKDIYGEQKFTGKLEKSIYSVPNFHTGNLYKTIDGAKTYAGNIFLYTDDPNRQIEDLGDGTTGAQKRGELSVYRTSYLWHLYSDDGGITWSNPVDINQTTKYGWMHFFGVGPGTGIQIQNGAYAGRLIVPVYTTNRANVDASQSSAIIYSDDNGETWNFGSSPRSLDGGYDISTGSNSGTFGRLTEAQPVEVGDEGWIQLYCRSNNGKYAIYATSKDGGITWENLTESNILTNPYSQLSIIRYPYPVYGKTAYLYACGGNNTSRKNGTIRMGFWNEETLSIDWQFNRSVNSGDYQYNSLAVLPDGDIALLFEADSDLKIQYIRMGLGWIMGGKDISVTGTNMSYFRLKDFPLYGNAYIRSDESSTNNKNIIFTLPFGTDISVLNNQIAEFGVADNTVVTVNGVEQISGITPNQISDGLIYTVNKDGITTNYTINITFLPDPSTSSKQVIEQVSSIIQDGTFNFEAEYRDSPTLALAISKAENDFREFLQSQNLFLDFRIKSNSNYPTVAEGGVDQSVRLEIELTRGVGIYQYTKTISNIPLVIFNQSLLKKVTLDGAIFPDFNSNTYEYTITLPKDNTSIPILAAEVRDNSINIGIVQASSLDEPAKIIIITSNGTVITYTIHFKLSDEVISDITPTIVLANYTVKKENANQNQIELHLTQFQQGLQYYVYESMSIAEPMKNYTIDLSSDGMKLSLKRTDTLAIEAKDFYISAKNVISNLKESERIKITVLPPSEQSSSDSSEAGSSNFIQKDSSLIPTLTIDKNTSLTGWSDIQDWLSKNKKNPSDKTNSLYLQLDKNNILPKAVLEELKNSNIVLNIQQDDVVWIFDGMLLTDSDLQETTSEINLNVQKNTNNIPSDAIDTLLENSTYQLKEQLNLAHSGKFGGKVSLKINLDNSYYQSGLNFFYFNPDNHNFTYQGFYKIEKDGTVILPLEHASDYLMVVSKNPLEIPSLSQISYQLNAGENSPILFTNLAANAQITCNSFDPFIVKSTSSKIYGLKQGNSKVAITINQDGEKYSFIITVRVKKNKLLSTWNGSTVKKNKAKNGTTQKIITNNGNSYSYTYGTLSEDKEEAYIYTDQLGYIDMKNTVYYNNIIYQIINEPKKISNGSILPGEAIVADNRSNPFIQKIVPIEKELIIDNQLYEVTKIDPLAFSNISKITNVIIPDSIKEIEGSAFTGCKNLKTFDVNSSNKYFSTSKTKNQLLNVNKDKLISYPSTKAKLKLSNHIKIIGKYSLSGSEKIKEITIPSSVEEIEISALSNLNALRRINFEGTTLPKMDIKLSDMISDKVKILIK